jgi:hypothetical protein
MKEEEEEEEESRRMRSKRRRCMRKRRVGKRGGLGGVDGAQMQSQHSWFGRTPCCGNSFHLRHCLTDATLSHPGKESRHIWWSLRAGDPSE